MEELNVNGKRLQQNTDLEDLGEKNIRGNEKR